MKLLINGKVIICVCMVLVQFGCNSNVNNPSLKAYQFPLKTGNQWKYIDRTEYLQTTSNLSTTITDTLIVKVLEQNENQWNAVLFSYISQGSKTDDTTFFINTDSGVFVKSYLENSGLMPLFKRSEPGNDDDNNDETLLLPSLKTPETWTMNQNRSAKISAPESLLVMGNKILCLKVDHFSEFFGSENPVWISSLYYDNSGIIKKTYKPDTLVTQGETTIISRFIELISY